jgi:hypothetical protein
MSGLDSDQRAAQAIVLDIRDRGPMVLVIQPIVRSDLIDQLQIFARTLRGGAWQVGHGSLSGEKGLQG